MLSHLSIQNFAIIEDLEVDFSSGFLVLSGETGAGKSIIIDALSLLMGERSTFSKIRNDAKKAYIEGVFNLDDELKNQLSNILDFDLEDNLIISRSLDISNKSICKIDNHIVNIATLKQVSSLLIDIHSQQKDAAFLSQVHQLSLLDKFIYKTAEEDELSLFKKYKEEYETLKKYQKEYQAILDNENNIGSLDYLEYQINELEKANVQENEMEDLEEERKSLNQFASDFEKLSLFLNNYEEASSLLFNARKTLNYVKDENFDELNEKFNDAYYNLEEIYQEIKDKFALQEEKLSRLDEINNRLFFLHSLRKKYGYTSNDIINRYHELKAQYDMIANLSYTKEKLSLNIANQENLCMKLSSSLTILRNKYAENISLLVNRELKDLSLENADFRIDFIKKSLSINGEDDIEFKLKANAGGNYLPLDKTASLGETSRLNLALKTVFNTISNIPTIIFDEIDVGLSGRVAYTIAKKMKLISKTSQVIAISHLGQVVASSDKHYFVKKSVIEDKTYSSIKLLNDKERLLEVAKMISGNDIKDVQLQAAQELIDSFK